MIRKRYLSDLERWEVLVIAENPVNDRQVGLFKLESEADACIVGLTFAI